jgi:hypothetical protein
VPSTVASSTGTIVSVTDASSLPKRRGRRGSV